MVTFAAPRSKQGTLPFPGNKASGNRTIERLDGVSPTPIAPADVSSGLAKAGNEVLGYVELVRAWWQERLADLPNQLRFSRNLYLSNGGVADRHHAFGTWRIEPDEALVLRFTPPETETWIFQLCSMWQENLDCYEDGTIESGALTAFQIALEQFHNAVADRRLVLPDPAIAQVRPSRPAVA